MWLNFAPYPWMLWIKCLIIETIVKIHNFKYFGTKTKKVLKCDNQGWHKQERIKKEEKSWRLDVEKPF